jgi:hypothetical protein
MTIASDYISEDMATRLMRAAQHNCAMADQDQWPAICYLTIEAARAAGFISQLQYERVVLMARKEGGKIVITLGWKDPETDKSQ